MSDSLFASVQAQILKSYEYLKDQYDSHLIQKLLYPDRVITVYIPVKMDNGQTQVFVWYRSQHNSARGPYKWGIRYHPDVSQDEVMSLSAWMSIKCSVVGIPLGGGKWGIVLDPKTLSSRELEQVSRWYIRALYKLIGKDVDVPAPDVNTDGRIMAWMADEYSRLVWVWTPGVITGKPLMSGGSLGRDVATALGWVYVLETYYAYKGKSLTWSTVTIQWAGNAGLNFAKLITQKWAIVTAISDSSWAIFDDKWLDIPAIDTYKQEGKSLIDYPHASHINNSDILTMNCDILVPAALEKQITRDNADQITAKCILELANGPTTAQADAILFSKHSAVIPDVLANAGGVTVSYFEQIQNNINHYRSKDTVYEQLHTIMSNATHECLQIADRYSVDLRTAAYIRSLKTILQAMKEREEYCI